MKYLSKKTFLLTFLLSFIACEDYIGGDINNDPNNPTTVPVSAQMPAIQIALADVYGGEFSHFNSMLIQQVEGAARCGLLNRYIGLTPNLFDNIWQNVYEKILNEIKIAKETTSKKGYAHYGAVLDILEAFTLMTATDVWDDMPYSDALKGIDALMPTYDTQASIYEVINHLLDNALMILDGSAGGLVPSSEEVFYDGDIEKWKKAARAIKARALLHLNDYAGAANLASQSFANGNENLAYQYPDAIAAGPWYRFNRDRTGDIEFNPTMRALMQGLNDVNRLAKLDQTFTTAHSYLIPDFLQELITYREMQFIIAEADVRQNAGGTAEGHTAYLAGIEASFVRLGVDGYEDYIAQTKVNPGIGNLTLEQVMTQKYIALFLQPEAYSDWRRTAIPILTPTSGTTIPVRWEYSATEYLFNSNAPAEGSVNIYTDRVGWNR